MAEQKFDALRPEERPQDSSGDGEGLRFTTHEHDEMNMPQAIEVRACGRALGGLRAAQKEREDRAAKTVRWVVFRFLLHAKTLRRLPAAARGRSATRAP